MQIFGKMAKKLAKGVILKFRLQRFSALSFPISVPNLGRSLQNGGAKLFSIMHGLLWRRHRWSI